MSDADRLTVFYSCDGCGLVDRAVSVGARGDEDVVSWMKWITTEIAFDHGIASPTCRASKVKHVKIPLPDGAERIGEAP